MRACIVYWLIPCWVPDVFLGPWQELHAQHPVPLQFDLAA
jgi:hypothetical protein